MKKYYLKKRFMLLVAGILALPFILDIALAVFLYFSELDPSLVFFPFIIVAIAAILGPVFIIRSVFIGISETGITYSLNSISIKAKWAEVKTISTLRSRFGEQEYLIVEKGLIPLEWFAENWRESELGQQIKQYAPHLFSPVENQETP